jgi:hypothetical protein
MTEAWMKREGERQDLRKEFKRALMDLEEEMELEEEGERQKFYFHLVVIMMKYLLENADEPPFRTDMSAHEKGATVAFYRMILPKVKKFARVKSEGQVIIGELITWGMETILRPFHSALLREEIHYPQEVFHASGAMARVEIEDEY